MELYYDGENNLKFKVIGLCPYHKLLKHKPMHQNGYCEFLELGDFDDKGTLLLFDLYKECEENLDDYFE